LSRIDPIAFIVLGVASSFALDDVLVRRPNQAATDVTTRRPKAIQWTSSRSGRILPCVDCRGDRALAKISGVDRANVGIEWVGCRGGRDERRVGP
jgi:hypothetical protein